VVFFLPFFFFFLESVLLNLPIFHALIYRVVVLHTELGALRVLDRTALCLSICCANPSFFVKINCANSAYFFFF